MKYLLITLLILSTSSVLAQQLPPVPTQVCVGWDIPTLWDDETPLALSDIDGYEILSSCLEQVHGITDPEQVSVCFPLAQFSNCTWQIQTVVKTGIRSEPSNKVTAEFKTPKAPVLRRVSF